jgi:hypothetical protein
MPSRRNRAGRNLRKGLRPRTSWTSNRKQDRARRHDGRNNPPHRTALAGARLMPTNQRSGPSISTTRSGQCESVQFAQPSTVAASSSVRRPENAENVTFESPRRIELDSTTDRCGSGFDRDQQGRQVVPERQFHRRRNKRRKGRRLSTAGPLAGPMPHGCRNAVGQHGLMRGMSHMRSTEYQVVAAGSVSFAPACVHENDSGEHRPQSDHARSAWEQVPPAGASQRLGSLEAHQSAKGPRSTKSEKCAELIVVLRLTPSPCRV